MSLGLGRPGALALWLYGAIAIIKVEKYSSHDGFDHGILYMAMGTPTFSKLKYVSSYLRFQYLDILN
jgi:hypothetical protein